MVAVFQFRRRLRMLDFGSLEGSAIPCWGEAYSGGWEGIGSRLEVGNN